MPSARHASAGSGFGSDPRPPVPSASASRGAGSIVQTSVRLPRRAAIAATAAAIVVFPTPPGPTQTRTRLSSTQRFDHPRRTSRTVMLSGPPASFAASISSWHAASMSSVDFRMRADLRVGNRAPQTVGAQQVEVARRHLVDVDVGLELVLAAQAAHDDVAVREARELLVRHLGTRGAHLLGDRMIARQLLQLAVAQAVRAAVARVRDRDLLLAHRHRDHRRAHPRARSIARPRLRGSCRCRP